MWCPRETASILAAAGDAWWAVPAASLIAGFIGSVIGPLIVARDKRRDEASTRDHEAVTKAQAALVTAAERLLDRSDSYALRAIEQRDEADTENSHLREEVRELRRALDRTHAPQASEGEEQG